MRMCEETNQDHEINMRKLFYSTYAKSTPLRKLFHFDIDQFDVHGNECDVVATLDALKNGLDEAAKDKTVADNKITRFWLETATGYHLFSSKFNPALVLPVLERFPNITLKKNEQNSKTILYMHTVAPVVVG
jgi:hypothetical protein